MTDRQTNPDDTNPTDRYEPPSETEPASATEPEATAEPAPTAEPVVATESALESPPPAQPPAPPIAPSTPPPPDRPWPPRTWQRSDDPGRIGTIVLGAILLVIGLWFFADQTLGLEMPRLRWSQLWPLLLIGLGVWIAIGSMRRR